MIIETDNAVFLLRERGGEVVKAFTSHFIDEWIVITENDLGDVWVEHLTELELIREYGPLPED